MRSVDYSGLTGKIITKESFEYEESRLAWNRAIEKYPLVIIYCNNEKDVINAILWAKNNSIEIRVRSGAHSYEGYSTGNDVAIIDISKMNEIYIDENNGFARIGGGVRNREIYENSRKQELCISRRRMSNCRSSRACAWRWLGIFKQIPRISM